MGPAKFLYGVAIAVLLAGTQALARPDDHAAIKSVAVVSALGSDIDLIVDTDFGSAERIPFHTKADIDDYIADHVKAALSERFSITSPGVDPTIFRSYENTQTFRKNLVASFAGTASPLPDAIILVHSATVEQGGYPIRALSFSYSGFSLTHTKGLFGKYSTLLSAQFAISVIDTKTGIEIETGKNALPAAGVFGRRPDPVILCDNQIWPVDPKTPTDKEATQIQADLMAVVAMSLPNALAAADLVSAGSDARVTQWDGQSLMCKPFD